MKWQQKHTSLLVIAIGFGILYFIFRKYWMLAPIGMVLIGFLINSVGEFIHLSWIMIAKVLGFINSRVLLTITFFIILTPIALLMRLLGKGNFLKSAAGKNSLLVVRNHLYTKNDLLNPF
jgi:Saxitoxin biosynthesis operon protein SxtJ